MYVTRYIFTGWSALIDCLIPLNLKSNRIICYILCHFDVTNIENSCSISSTTDMDMYIGLSWTKRFDVSNMKLVCVIDTWLTEDMWLMESISPVDFQECCLYAIITIQTSFFLEVCPNSPHVMGRDRPEWVLRKSNWQFLLRRH